MMASAKSEPMIFRAGETVVVPRHDGSFYALAFRRCPDCGMTLVKANGKIVRNHRPFGQTWRCLSCSERYLERFRAKMRERWMTRRTVTG